MKILCVSDSHGDLDSLQKIVDRNPQARLLLHMGDGNRELEELSKLYPKLEYAAVRGNCDRMSDFPVVESMIVRGVHILLTHGHLYSVKLGLSELYRLAAERRPDLCLFGHTHRPYCQHRDGVWYLNPGSASHLRGGGSYGLVTLEDRQIKDCQLLEL